MSFDINKIWDGEVSVLLTSFWGWAPESWGMVSFAWDGRRNTVISETTDPFIALIYITKNAPIEDKSLRGKVMGFYLCSHSKGHRDEFTHVSHHSREPDKWWYGLKAIRAFSFHKDHLMTIDEFDPTLSKEQRNQAVGTHGEILSDLQNWQKLKDVPFKEVPCFDAHVNEDFTHDPWEPANKGMVGAGPNNNGGYYVPPKSSDLPRQLYVLRLRGNTDHFLGKPSKGHFIHKIGLSVAPSDRQSAFNKALPEGAFVWETILTTRRDGDDQIFSFNAAVAGETAMKKQLSQNGKWLGEEFYLAEDAAIQAAWNIGRQVANNFIESEL